MEAEAEVHTPGTDPANTIRSDHGHGKVIVTFLAPLSYTFTNAGATGREGPTQSNIDSAYLGTNLENKVTINTRGIQEWTVPESGIYRIEAWGAEGGAASGTNGGKGAFSSGLFTFNDGQKLFLNIGQKGTDSTGGVMGGGGGGGSFIYDQSQSLKIILVVVVLHTKEIQVRMVKTMLLGVQVAIHLPLMETVALLIMEVVVALVEEVVE